MATRRLAKELQSHKNDAPTNYGFGPQNDNLFLMNGFVIGPDESPYKDGIYHFLIVIPSNYPFKPPIIRMSTKIYHPNINENGVIKLNILDNWSPALSISKLFVSIINLLNEPNPFLGILQPEIAEIYNKNDQIFIQTAKEWNDKYSGGEQIDLTELYYFAATSMNEMNERYNAINKSINNLFGDSLGKIFENIILMYYGKIKEETKKCNDYDDYLKKQYKIAQGKQNINVFVKRINGKVLTVKMNKNDYIYLLKIRVSDIEWYSPEHQRLIFEGKSLDNGQTLNYYGITNESTIYIVGSSGNLGG